MSRRTPGAGVALALVAGLATWVSLWAWRGFVVDSSTYLLPAAGGIAAISVAGVLMRAARMPAVVVAAGQLLVVMLVGNLAWGSSAVPTRESLRTAVQAVRTAVESSQAYAAPVPPEAPSVVPLLLLGALLLHLLVDLFAVTLGRVPIAGLPLLTIYSLPVSVLQDGVGWFVFALAAACFLTMLALQERTRVSRWGRPFAPATAVSPHQAGGAGMAAAAILAALVVPFVVPTFDLGLLDRLGTGTGAGNDGEVRIENPMTDLKRDLVLGPDVPLLQVAGTSGAPSYVRIAVLTTFTGQAWTPGDRDLPQANAADGEVPWPIGLEEDVPHQEQERRFAASDALDSKWLPVPRFVSAVDTGGDEWRYDDRVLDFHARDDDVSTADQTWSAVELDLALEASALDAAGTAPTPLFTTHTALPDDLPRSVVELAERVTADARTDYEKAVMLQRFFQSEFEYDISRQPGNGSDALEQFLSEGDRRGYCEQFASAMAVMLRAVDVPARVSVGLLRPEAVDRANGVYEFSSRDMHAWPEVYLGGYGWVMFEPTPTTHTESLPDYSRGVRPEQEPTDPATTRDPSASASPSASLPATPSASPAPAPAEEADGGRAGGSGSPWVTVLWVLGAVLLLAALALLPRLLRSRRSERRWHGHLPPAEAAWAELRDRVVDLGLAWPAGRSPRRTADLLAEQLAAPRTPDTPQRPRKGPRVAPEAAAALQALTGALEEARYAPPGAAQHDADELRARVETVGASLEAGTTPARRHTAHWLPRSLVRRSSATDETDELVDSIH